MKKIITLLISTGIFTASYAQENHDHGNRYNRHDQYASASNGRYDRDDDDERDDGYRRDGYQQRNQSYAYQRQIQIDRINREYSYKVMSIQQNPYMSNRQRRLAIRDAKKERNYQMQMINRNMNGYANNSYGSNNSHGRNNDYGKHYDEDRR
jgi:hypothetical protein